MQILIILCIFSISITLCSRGFVKIKGQFLCNGLPWKNEKVAIYEANYVLPDTMFAMNLTDSDGNFNLEASGKDIYPIRPYIYLPNYCNAAQFLNREWAAYLRIRIPDFYIESLKNQDFEPLDFGRIELSHVESEQIGFHKFTDLIKNFAESRPIRKGKRTKMSEM
ncbi:Transthyretin-like family-containing protein [Caenorhabditis elegans]|uniref:Transthyretin-like family-containing protein n=1 Tax=Caenorhabditis elegans TaxID=6239 RepID=O62448_CAEEL|nr:Transthyretin-like family-containing protein [Caenorhabditis elegans]CAA16372.1 Transthyretin-like family-containing protein [Caenorhabditis elegans]|eukprot:NP_507986.1 TransThyretin-Related family domain [Caenorhabditis elegans]